MWNWDTLITNLGVPGFSIGAIVLLVWMWIRANERNSQMMTSSQDNNTKMMVESQDRNTRMMVEALDRNSTAMSENHALMSEMYGWMRRDTEQGKEI
jgi:hypothetical protein